MLISVADLSTCEKIPVVIDDKLGSSSLSRDCDKKLLKRVAV
jgi:hypothetical protein